MRDRNLEKAEFRIDTECLPQLLLRGGAIARGRGDQSGVIMHLTFGRVRLSARVIASRA